jgi:hypothetical protein
MIMLELFSLMIDWTYLNYQLSVFTIHYPFKGIFRTSSLFALITGDEIFLEVFFITLIGEKQHE